MYLILYVDDMLIMSKAQPRVMQFKAELKDEFTIHDLGEVQDFLGCQIVRDREARVMWAQNRCIG